MNVRTTERSPRHTQATPPRLNQSGVIQQIIVIGTAVFILWLVFYIFNVVHDRNKAPISEVKSGIIGYCLDDHNSGKTPGDEVDSWQCNGSGAQNWKLRGNMITHDATYCLTANNDNQVVLGKCKKAADQDWVRDLDGYQNGATGKCLSLPDAHTNVQLVVASCNNLSELREAWTPATWNPVSVRDVSSGPCMASNGGQRIACYAQRQWVAWESDPNIHGTLLSDYTDGNPYEEWCADFVSYVYKEAGYPFTSGERSGWDQYTASDVQYMGFTLHAANSGYVPQPGDVAYFNYPGGHVEIVVTGGKHPTFIYGDAGTIDPKTGNGEMSKNSFTSDGSAGQLVYYLSPDGT